MMRYPIVPGTIILPAPPPCSPIRPSPYASYMLCVLLIVAVLINFCAAVGEGASDNSNERWVNEINLYRCIHGLRPLSWDASLAEAASALANSLSATGSLFIPDPHRNTIAFGFGEFLCSNRYRQFDQTCAVWFWYLQYLDTMGQDGCGHSPIKGKDKWSPSNIADVKILLSDRVEFVGCAGNNLYYACEFDAGCGLPREPCGSNTTELEHCVDETCFWCRENTRVSSCWKWNPYVDLGIWQSTTTTSLPSEPDLEAAVTTTSTPLETPNLRGTPPDTELISTLPQTVLTDPGPSSFFNDYDDDGLIVERGEVSVDPMVPSLSLLLSKNFYCETPEEVTAAHTLCSSIQSGSWCQLDAAHPTCFGTSQVCGCFDEDKLPSAFHNPSGECTVLDSHYFCQTKIRNGRCRFENGPPYLCEGSDINCDCDHLLAHALVL